MPTSPEVFNRIAPKVADLVENGPVALRVMRAFNPFTILFDLHFRDPEVADAVKELELSRVDFRAALNDLQEVLSALVQGAELTRVSEDKDSEEESVTKAKSETASRYFDIDDLQRRWWVKANAKTDLLMESGWDVSLKLLDEAERSPDDLPVPVGLLSLKGSKFATPFALFDSANNELAITVDREDIKALRQTLRRLDESLIDAERRRTSNE